MKILFTSFNKKLGFNPMVQRLFDPLPEFQPAGVHDCEAVFLSFIAPEHDFEPDKMLLDAVSRRKLPVVIFDHSETFPENFVFPFCPVPQESPYKILESIVQNQMDVKAYFKRELINSGGLILGGTFPLYPLDWVLHPMFGDPPIDTLEQYSARPIDIFFSWGYSNESRPKLMGELLRQAGKFSAHWCLTEEDLDRALAEGRERIFALLFTPDYRRIHIKKLMEWQAKSKIAVSLFGAGKKCFRNAEASYNTVMAQQAPGELQWSYPWIARENCMNLPEHKSDEYPFEVESVGRLYDTLRINQGTLHPMYLKGIENSKRYHNIRYSREFLLPKLKEALR